MTIPLTIPLKVGHAPFYEDQRGHRCNTWQGHGSTVGLDCPHGFVILPGDVQAALARADRIPESADA